MALVSHNHAQPTCGMGAAQHGVCLMEFVCFVVVAYAIHEIHNNWR